MKRIFFTLAAIMLTVNIIYSQNAVDYFPSEVGRVWYSKISALDTLGQPIDSLSFYQADSFTTNGTYYGDNASLVLRAYSPAKFVRFSSFRDSAFFKFNGSAAYEYVKITSFLDTAIYSILDSSLYYSLDSLSGWYPLFDFALNVGSSNEIFSKDFTIEKDSLQQNIRVKLTTMRLLDENISLDVGNFNTKKFKYTLGFYFVVQILPPPFPPQEIPFFVLQNFSYIAKNDWVVKQYTPTQFYDFSQIGGPSFYLPGNLAERINKPMPSKVEGASVTPAVFSLSQNYPNPFGEASSSGSIKTAIEFRIPQASFVSLKVYDILGREVRTLVNAYQQRGMHVASFNSENLSSGIYFYSLECGRVKIVKKMTLLK